MLEIKCLTLGFFATNTYIVTNDEWISEDRQQQVLLIDPACSNPYEQQQVYAFIENQLRSRIPSLRLSIIATHGHLDHLWGAAWACAQWNTSVLMHPADISMAQAMQQQYDLFGIRLTAEPFPITPLENAPVSSMTILQTPGHTPGSVCLYLPQQKTLFSGDTLFRMGYGRTDLPGGDYRQLIQSLNRLFELPADVQVFPGHGEPTTIALEWR